MIAHCTVALILSAVVFSEKQRITIGAFLGDHSVPFGIYRSGPAIELGLQKLNELTAGEFDVEIIRYISGFECSPEMTGIFATVAAELYHKGNISAILGPSMYMYAVHLTPYMAEKIMSLQVDQQYILDEFSLNIVCSLPLIEYIFS
jgi:hypothetical protein